MRWKRCVIAALMLGLSAWSGFGIGGGLSAQVRGGLTEAERVADLPAGTDTAIAAESYPLEGQSAERKEEEQETASPSSFKLERVNGVSVQDDLKTVYEIKGAPLAVEEDKWLPGLRVFVYEDCRVGLYEQFVQYVMVPAKDGGRIEVDGKRLRLDAGKLREALGEPQFMAEDGIVYRRGSAVLKLFIDPETGRLESVHYFHEAAV